jgi:hypothetical protein
VRLSERSKELISVAREVCQDLQLGYKLVRAVSCGASALEGVLVNQLY